MVQRSPAEPSLSGFRLPSGAVLISIIAICLAGLATVAPAEDPFVILDPASEVYRRMAVGAGERVQIDKDTEVTGDVHSNDDVDLKKDTLVDGDVSATGEVKSKGTVTGEVTEGAAEIVLPALPSETELRALADRIFEGDVTLTDEVVDDVVFVGGKVRICGSLNGTGTLIAAGKITFEKADYGDSASGGPGVEAGDGDSKSGCGASTAVLESSTRMSLISLDTITFANNRRFRGVLRSALDVKLNKESVFEGVVLADDTVLVKKDSRITFATPVVDEAPPAIAVGSPAFGRFIDGDRTDVVLEYSDDVALELATLEVSLSAGGELIDLLAGCVVNATSAVCPTPALPTGGYRIDAAISDRAGNRAETTSVFLVDLEEPDVEAPAVTFAAPSAAVVEGTGELEVEVRYSDAETGVDPGSARLLLDGADVTGTCQVNSDVFFCDLVDLAPGNHRLEAMVADFALNPGGAAFDFELRMEQEPPEITIFSPEGPIVFGVSTVEVRAQYVDEVAGVDLGSVRLLLDGADVTAQCRVNARTLVCDALGVTAGDRTLRLEAADRLGNAAAEANPFRVVLDASPPALAVTSPSTPTVVTADPLLTVAGTATAASGLAALLVGGEEVPVAADGAFAAQVSLLSGYNSIAVIARDEAGRETAAGFEVFLDDEAPEIRLFTPEDGLVTHAASVELAGQVLEESGQATLEVDGEPVALETENLRFSFVVELADGVNAITLVVRDGAGNETSEVLQVTRRALPGVTIDEPLAGTVVDSATVVVRGTVEAGVDSVTVNGVEATLSGALYEAEIALAPGANRVVAGAVAGSRRGQAAMTVFRQVGSPVVTLTSPADGSTVGTSAVSVAGTVFDLLNAPGAASPTVEVNGIAAEVRDGSFLAAEVPLAPGTHTIRAVVDASGRVAEQTITVVRDDGPRPRLAKVEGDGQSGPVGGWLPQPLTVRVVDVAGQGVPGVSVVFRVDGNNGGLGASAGTAGESGERSQVVESDLDGLASVFFRLGTRSGSGNQRVRAAATGYAGPARFLASATPGPATSLVVESGAGQVGVTGQDLPEPFVAVAIDPYFNRLRGEAVTFAVRGGGGELRALDAAGLEVRGPEVTVATDVQGRAVAFLTLGAAEGADNHTVEAFFPSLGDEDPAPFALFSASGRTALDGVTSVSGVVLDNTDLPIPGAKVHLHGTTLISTTDATGAFRLEGAPAGPALLEIDGGTSSRPGVWPRLEFEMNLIPGRENSLGRPAYLPPIDVENGLAVDAATGGVLTLEEIPGLALEVAPGSVTFGDGSKEGVVSVSVVRSDKVPMAPSLGRDPRLVLTIQPAAASFDPPARLTLPNTEGLEPGQVTEFFSFDHDLQKFLPIGTATVADDGLTVTTDPGFGIVEAGWHWACGGSSGSSGTAHDCKQCFECKRGLCRVDPDRIGESCDDGDPCTFEDECTSTGACAGTRKRFTKVEARVDDNPNLSIRELEDEFRFTVDWELNKGSCPAEYLWDFGDGSTSTERNPSHAYEAPGEYRVLVLVKCKDCKVSGFDGVRAVAAKVEISAEATDRNNPRNRSRISVFEGRPVFAGDGDVGDFVYYEARVEPLLAARLASTYTWSAEGPESQSGPSGPERKWEIEDEPIDWTPGEYMVKVEVDFEDFPATLEDEFRQVVGVRTPEYFYVGAITDAGNIPTAGVEPRIRIFFSCPLVPITLLEKTAFGGTFTRTSLTLPWAPPSSPTSPSSAPASWRSWTSRTSIAGSCRGSSSVTASTSTTESSSAVSSPSTPTPTVPALSATRTALRCRRCGSSVATTTGIRIASASSWSATSRTTS